MGIAERNGLSGWFAVQNFFRDIETQYDTKLILLRLPNFSMRIA
ncbi:MAG: hypothetical protein WA941_09255 [Nitrososphaeraceae archaeon]